MKSHTADHRMYTPSPRDAMKLLVFACFHGFAVTFRWKKKQQQLAELIFRSSPPVFCKKPETVAGKQR